MMPVSRSQLVRGSEGVELNPSAAEPHVDTKGRRPGDRARVGVPRRIAVFLIVGLIIAILIGLYLGYQPLNLVALKSDPISRAVFFRLRLPRVLVAGMVGASLAMVGAARQALFRNPLADAFTLGVTGGASLGASVAIAFGLGLNLVGVPLIFIAAFGGATVSVLLVY